MLFSFKRLLLPAIGALALLQCAVARPLLPVANNDLIERREAYENTLLDRKIIDLELEARSDVVDDSLLERAWLDRRADQRNLSKNTQIKQPFKEATEPNPFSKGKAKTDTGSATTKPRNRRKGLPNSTKLKLDEKARQELNNIGVHGKARKDTIKWHKYQIKQQMKTKPLLIEGQARTGTIEHIAHEGGSDPKEKNHITASFRSKLRQEIKNDFNGGGYHHLYVNNKGLPPQAKPAMHKNNAQIKGQSKSHQTSVGRTRTPGKSSNKGKGKQHSGKEFSKNPNKGIW